MKKKEKLGVSLVACLLAGAVLGLRLQAPYLSIPSLLALIAITVFTGRLLPIGTAGLALIFLYAGPQAGALYIRGSHVGGRVATEIATQGWPLPSSAIIRGFPETPLLHIHTLIVNAITELEILPTSQPQILVSWLLPLWYVSVALLFVLVTARHFRESQQVRRRLPPVGIMMIPVVLWIPLYRAKTGFSRQSIAVALFALTVFVLYRWYHSPSNRWGVIALFGAGSTVVSHHLTSVMLGIFFAVVLLYVFSERTLDPSSLVTPPKPVLTQMAALYLFILVFFLIWQYVVTTGGINFTVLIASVGFSGEKLGTILSFILGSGTTEQVGLPVAERGPFMRFQSFFGYWLYQLLIGIGCVVASAYWWFRGRDLGGWVNVVTVFGVTTGILAVLSWVTGIGDIARITTFFVLVGAWISPIGVYLAFDRVNEHRLTLTRVFVLGTVVVGLLLIPPYVVSDVEPRYTQAETDQRFPAQYYAGGEFIGQYTSEETPIAGDENTEHILIATTGRQASNPPSAVLNGTVPNGGVLMLLDYNDRLFFGAHRSVGNYAIVPTATFETVQSKNSMIYSNGKATIYTDTPPSE
nr:hypothetical protein [Halapricum salinum]